jgi:hypothetical protein
VLRLLVVTAVLSAALAGSGGGTPYAAPTQAGCSRATALEVAKPLFVWGNNVRTPIGQVLCGPFAGPGSTAMAVTLVAPTCWPRQGWAVYRFVDGAWQLVLSRPYVFIFQLDAVGGDIRETAPVFRPGDARCTPSGGKKARLWHWSGSRFTAGPWKTSGTPVPSKLHYFESPSHNIWCSSGDEGRAYCATHVPAHSAELQLNGRLTVCARRRCGGPARWGHDPVLAYGQVNSQGGFRCKSETAGMTCTVMLRGRGFAFGKGFRISRSGVVRFG